MTKRNKLKSTISNTEPTNLPVLDINEVDQAGYGALNIPESARKIAEPFNILDITLDPAQPRNQIPRKAKTKWNGKPKTIGGLLMEWQKLAEENYDAIPTKKILEGVNSIKDLESDKKMPSITEDYLNVVSLAASIHKDGLLNPITISTSGSPRKIIAGETRFLAYCLLNMFFQGEYAQIPAFEEKPDVWKQAAENGARRPLNAIGTARQLALLLMDLYKDTDGADFQPYHQLVIGENDQAFYAQVKNGYVYPIKSEFAQRIIDVTGLKSARMISAYRGLLDIPADIWMLADEENWTEFGIRTHLKPPKEDNESLPTGKLSNEEDNAQNTNSTPVSSRFARHTDTAGQGETVTSLQRPTITPPQKTGFIPESPAPGIKPFMLSVGVIIVDKNGAQWKIEQPPIGGNQLYSCINAHNIRKNVHINQISSITPPDSPGAQGSIKDIPVGTETSFPEVGEGGASASDGVVEGSFYVGDTVRTRTGHTGKILNISGTLILVSFGNYSTNHYAKDLEIAYPASDTPPNEPVGTMPALSTNEEVEDTIEDEFIFAEFDDTLMPLFKLANVLKMEEAGNAIRELGDMPTDALLELAKNGTIKPVFQSYYDSICLMLDQTKHHLHDILDNVEAAAIKEAGENNDD